MTPKKQKPPAIRTYDTTRFFTPKKILDLVERIGPIGLDPCGDYESKVRARHTVLSHTRGFELLARHYHMPHTWNPSGDYERDTLRSLAQAGVEIANGLEINWNERTRAGEVTFCNPPYSAQDNKRWGAKVAASGLGLHDRHLIGLIPVATGAQWWKNYWRADAVCFLEARLSFGYGADAPAEYTRGIGAFDSAIPYWGPDVETFARIFETLGEVVVPRRARATFS